MTERSGIYKFSGKDVTIIGDDIIPGQKAPDFLIQDQSWEMLNALASTTGKVRILAAVPSLETSVCDRETRKFNESAAGLSENITIYVISADLPFTQKRWCGAAGIDQVQVVSDHMQMDFGKKYGCLIKEARILRRSVFVIDRNDNVVYVEYTPVMGQEPDYEAVLEAAKQAL